VWAWLCGVGMLAREGPTEARDFLAHERPGRLQRICSGMVGVSLVLGHE